MYIMKIQQYCLHITTQCICTTEDEKELLVASKSWKEKKNTLSCQFIAVGTPS